MHISQFNQKPELASITFQQLFEKKKFSPTFIFSPTCSAAVYPMADKTSCRKVRLIKGEGRRERGGEGRKIREGRERGNGRERREGESRQGKVKGKGGR